MNAMGKNKDDLNWEKVEGIIDKALTLPREKRTEYVNYRCYDDEKLKTEVITLLDSIERSEGWLEGPETFVDRIFHDVFTNNDTGEPENNMEGKRIGVYKIRKLIGEGGMGRVYLADRDDGAFEQEVALKVIRQGMDSEQNIKRFKQERNILAGLNHPGIAGLYYGGVMENGFPYLVMEYVDGTPIDRYCDRHQLSVDKRIDLFRQVLDAVQYAHENLVIHRDLKPDNILVTQEGRVKILDFGIAKLLSPFSDSSEASEQMMTQMLMMTPKYAAPEQISERQVTTATDVYSIGVVLYKLLTGLTPYDLAGKGLYEVQQTILEESPKWPNNRFCEMDSERKEKTAENRSTTVAKLLTILKGDYGAILLKAIQKNPKDRYRSAIEFAEDLEACQNGLPVKAQTNTFAYRSSKFFQRNRYRIAGASVLILLLMGMAGFSLWNINKERNQANIEAEKATQIKNFMLDMFRSNNHRLASYAGPDLTVRDVMTVAIDQVNEELADQPEVYIEMLSAIGESLRNLDEYDRAYEAMSAALDKSNQHYGDTALETAKLYAAMANIKRSTGDYTGAEEHLAAGISILENHHPDLKRNLANQYSDYGFNKAFQGNYREAKSDLLRADSLYIASGNEDFYGRYISLSNLAEVEVRLREFEQAEERLIEAIAFFEEYYDGLHSNIATNWNKLGYLYHLWGKYEKADEILNKSLEMRLELHGEHSSRVATNYRRLGLNYRLMNEMEKARESMEKAGDIHREIYGEQSLNYAYTLNNIALIYTDMGESDRARQMYKNALQIKEREFNQANPALATTLYNLADLLYQSGELEEARDKFERVVEIDRKIYGEDHAEIAVDLNKLGAVYRDLGEYEQAETILQEAALIFESEFPENHFRIAEHKVETGRLLLETGNSNKAKLHFNQAIEIFLQNFDEDDSRVREAIGYLEQADRDTENLSTAGPEK